MFEVLKGLIDLVPAVAVILSIGIAYGVLKVKSATTATRLDQLEAEALSLDSAMRHRVDGIATELSQHKHDTTDRLARIETKLDILLQQNIIK